MGWLRKAWMRVKSITRSARPVFEEVIEDGGEMRGVIETTTYPGVNNGQRRRTTIRVYGRDGGWVQLLTLLVTVAMGLLIVLTG